MTHAATGYIRTHKRFWEIDLARTFAIVMMITFHSLYLLNYFNIQNTGVPGPYLGFWWWISVVTVSLFTFLAGLSLTITYSRGKRMSGFMLRGLEIFGWGMGITLITWLISRTDYVKFGILHFFGIAFILAPLFLRFRYINLILGTAVMGIGLYLIAQGIFVDSPWLLWLAPYSFRTLDYWPLVPSFGLFLVGMFFGKILYPQGNRRFHISDFNNPVILALTLPGRHPFVIYLVQWPVLIGFLLVLFPANVLPYFPSLPF